MPSPSQTSLNNEKGTPPLQTPPQCREGFQLSVIHPPPANLESVPELRIDSMGVFG